MKKNCTRCLKRARVKEAEYCGCCLAEIVERRVKKKLGALAAGKIVLACSDKESLQCSVAAYLIKKMAKPQMPLANAVKSKAVVAAKCADELAAGFIQNLTASLSGSGAFSRKNKLAPTNIFESVTEKELEIYAGIKKIKYTKAKMTGLRKKVLEFQAMHPGTVEALAKSGRQLGGL